MHQLNQSMYRTPSNLFIADKVSEYMYKDKDRAWVEGARHDDQGTNDSPLALNANIRED